MGERQAGLRQLGAENFNALAALGGLRGIAESVLPVLSFVLLYLLTAQNLLIALLGALIFSLGAGLLRLAQQQTLTQAIGGTVLVVLSALWAWKTGTASNFYALGLGINILWLLVALASLVAGWPLVGVVISLARGESLCWRTAIEQTEVRRRYRWGTGALAAMFGLRLAVELPLYLSGESAATALGLARLVLGVPLFALTLWLIWLYVRPIVHCSADMEPTEQ